MLRGNLALKILNFTEPSTSFFLQLGITPPFEFSHSVLKVSSGLSLKFSQVVPVKAKETIYLICVVSPELVYLVPILASGVVNFYAVTS